MIKFFFRFLMKTRQKHFICLILVVRDSIIEELREALKDVNHRLAGQARQQASIADQQPPLPPPPTSPPPATMPVSVTDHVAIPVVDFTAAPAASTAVPAASTAVPAASTAATAVPTAVHTAYTAVPTAVPTAATAVHTAATAVPTVAATDAASTGAPTASTAATRGAATEGAARVTLTAAPGWGSKSTERTCNKCNTYQYAGKGWCNKCGWVHRHPQNTRQDQNDHQQSWGSSWRPQATGNAQQAQSSSWSQQATGNAQQSWRTYAPKAKPKPKPKATPTMINGWVTANGYAANAGSTTTATDPATVAASTAEASTAQASTAAAASTAAEASTAAPLSTPEPPVMTGGTVPPATSTPEVVVIEGDDNEVVAGSSTDRIIRNVQSRAIICTICHQTLSSWIAFWLPCCRCFHVYCIRKWWDHSKKFTCPVCKNDCAAALEDPRNWVNNTRDATFHSGEPFIENELVHPNDGASDLSG